MWVPMVVSKPWWWGRLFPAGAPILDDSNSKTLKKKVKFLTFLFPWVFILQNPSHKNGQLKMAFLGRYERSVLIWDSRAGVSPMGWLSGIDICGDSLDISRDGYTLLVGLVGVGGLGQRGWCLWGWGSSQGTWRGPSESHVFLGHFWIFP